MTKDTQQPNQSCRLCWSLFYEWVGSLRVGWVGGRRGGTEGHLGMDIYRIGMGGTNTQVPSIVIPV